MEKWDRASTGLRGLDKVIDDLRVGDNVVWQMDEVEDYRQYVLPYINASAREGKKIVYIRFGNHPPLLSAREGVIVHELNAATGFESFSMQLFQIINREGRDVHYVFDCLSDLLSAWATDLMIGNFFLITCPFLFDMGTVAYFSILRNRHSFKTIARIRETTQVLLEIYNLGGKYCVHPLKASGRYSPTMFFPHIRNGDEFIPVVNSSDAAGLLLDLSRRGMDKARRNLDYWDRLFMSAEDQLASPRGRRGARSMVDQVSRILIGREERMLSLVRKNLFLEDLLRIKERMIGTGFLGGKTVGMLLARSILNGDRSFDWKERLEPHDSFYIGSDVFYSYIVQNGWWRLFMRQRTEEEYFSAAADLREKILHGSFPEEIIEQFQLMLEYFGQSPIIVRSSSLLEDAFGNAFAGKYESIFCPNQGSPEMRYEFFEQAVRRIFASSMNEDALVYRMQQNLHQKDELMSLLVQRVSGSSRKRFFFPEVAGVGFSENPYVWTARLNPRAGMLRIVFGLGTRAVRRDVSDYPRIVALDEPLLKPHSGIEDARKYSQHEVDVINLGENRFETVQLDELEEGEAGPFMELMGVRNNRIQEDGGESREGWILTFDDMLSRTSFTEVVSRMLKTLQRAYRYPVDIEFTANFSDAGIKINLLQCRPLQTKGEKGKVKIPAGIEEERIFLRQKGHFMGGSISRGIAQVVYVDPEIYAGLGRSERYDIARLIGKLNRRIEHRENTPVFLLGPGRWGSSSPYLGIPVRFAEISRFAAIGEISDRKRGMDPDLSFGAHFFQDLVENDIFYVAVFPERPDVLFAPDVLGRFRDISETAGGKYGNVVRVYETPGLRIAADMISQKLVCYS